MAKNYNKSDYALNKFSEALVYSGAEGAYELSKAAFLASDPALTEADYDFWKQYSDNDYLEVARCDTFEGKHTVPLDEIADAALISTETTEDAVLENIEPTPNPYTIENAIHILDSCLTEIQKSRYLKYYRDGRTIRDIADEEGVHFTSVCECINAANKKIQKIFE